MLVIRLEQMAWLEGRTVPVLGRDGSVCVCVCVTVCVVTALRNLLIEWYTDKGMVLVVCMAVMLVLVSSATGTVELT